MSGFDVDTARLRQLSAAFDQETGPLAARASAFAAEARAVDAAFGLLGASDEVYQAYIRKLDEFVAGLRNLGGGLGAVAAGLAGDADAYDRADALTAPGQP
jgi:hypothetical protein